MAINATWYKAHKMPPRATLEQRIEWRMAHRKACACREIPPKLAEEMKKRGLI